MSRSEHFESQLAVSGARLNWLRASVLGANDGIVSVAALLVGIAGATDSSHFILTAGIAGILSGALSMAAGEYVSVSTQRDTEKALIKKELEELATMPQEELEELTRIYQSKGLTRKTAENVAEELTKHDAFAAHAEAELGIDPNNLTDPMAAAFASALSFTAGGIIPLATILFTPEPFKIPATFAAVLVALMITGALSAYMGGAGKRRATIRVVFGGLFAMVVTFIVGKFFGISV